MQPMDVAGVVAKPGKHAEESMRRLYQRKQLKGGWEAVALVYCPR